MKISDEKKGGIWVQAIVGVIVALAAGGTSPWWWGKLLDPSPSKSSEPSNPSNPAQPVAKTNKTLTVYADSTKGASWLNKENGYVKVNFEATGQWLAIAENNSDSGVPDHAKGYLSPNGDPNFNSNTTVCARAPLGALVVIGEDKQCKAYGAEGSFDLKPGETVFFMMNDVPVRYQDNKGQVDVELSISKE
ncbi:MAG: hypothetical protein LH702_30255 [Phormidesmis sp. CAN_BIN44]|nr:hypothetical protein [Phormidesmis sp. CAN_BIN44]